MDINWTRGNGTACAVFLKQTDTGMPLPSDGGTYLGNSIFNSANDAGAGWQCVYSGAGSGPGSSANSVRVTNLQAGKIYRAMVCEYISTGAGTEVYNRFSGPNNPTNSGVPGIGWTPMASPVTTFTLHSVWGSAPNNVFAVGDGGTILHYDGLVWTIQSSGTAEALWSVWGTGPGNVYAAGLNRTLLHYDGISWTPVAGLPGGVTASTGLISVWGNSPNDIFVVGESETILHYDGSSWTKQSTGATFESLFSVWGSGTSDVYAVGTNRKTVHYNGISWSVDATVPASSSALEGIWGTSGTDIFVVGNVGSATTILHFNGASWTESDTTAIGYINLQGIWGVSANNIYAVGTGGNILNFDGSAWQKTNSGSAANLYGIWGTAADNVFAVGTNGTILRFGPTVQSTTTTTIIPTTTTTVFSTIPTTTTTIFSTSTSTFLPTSTTTMISTTTSIPIPGWNVMAQGMTFQTLWSVWGSSGSNVFAVGDGGTILHYNGTGWAPSTFGSTALLAVAGAGENDVHAVGAGGTILHYNGSSWITEPSYTGYDLKGIWVEPAIDSFVVGSGGTILHDNGTGWTAMSSAIATPLNAVWGSLSTDVFAVGAGGVILHYDGTSWIPMTSGTGNELNGVWGSGPSDVFAVGFMGSILHYDGSVWSAMINPLPSMPLYSVWGSSDSDVYAVGAARTILHYNGTVWDTITTGSFENLWGVWGSASKDVFAVGYMGLILHFNGGTTGLHAAVPDTGQIKCYDNTTEIACPLSGQPYYGQDAQYTINTPKYTKLSDNGTALPDNASFWAAVHDDVTGLIWEEKHNMGGGTNYADPNNADNVYTWFDNNSATNGGNPGISGAGTDTMDFIRDLNAANYGGFNDWRLPTAAELFSMTNLNTYGPAIDPAYFPNTVTSFYWSSSTCAQSSSLAWNLVAYYGYVNSLNKTYSYYARAVRGGQLLPLRDYVISIDGTVSDLSTGLMWQRDTAPGLYSWQQALAYCDNLTLGGFTDWRLPTPKEMVSIVDYSKISSPAIDATVFLNTQTAFPYWSSTTFAYFVSDAWIVNFTDGAPDFGGKIDSKNVRAVRSGQSGTLGAVNISSFTAAPLSGPATLPVTFNCIASTDLAGSSVAQYRWDFNGDNVIDEVTAVNSTSYNYTTPGSYNARVIVVSNKGEFAGSQRVTINVFGATSTTTSIFSTTTSIFSTSTTTIPSTPAWTPMPSGTTMFLNAVWGSSGTDAFVVGDNGTILHYNGSSWASMLKVTTKLLNGVWGSGGSDVFAVGNNGIIAHYNGSTWTVMSSSTGEPLNAVWGSSSTDVFAVGGMGAIAHYNGTLWSNMTSGVTTAPLNGVWGFSGTDVFAVGGTGIILHYNGTSWSPMTSGSSEVLYDVWGSSGTDVYVAASNGKILHYNGSTWSTMTTPTSEYLLSIWGSGSNDIFAVGNAGVIVHYDGSNWQILNSGTIDSLHGVWGNPGVGVLAVGANGTIRRLEPPSAPAWQPMASSTTDWLFDVWGPSPNDIFAVGGVNPLPTSGGTILHYNGITWSPMTSGTMNWLRSVWGSSGTDVYATGDAGTLLHYNGIAWSTISTGTTEALSGIWGFSDADIFVVGGLGTILHYNGTSWKTMDSTTTNNLFGVWGISNNDVYAVGTGGTILRYNGLIWSAMTSGTATYLNTVWGMSSIDVLAAGAASTIVQYDGIGITWSTSGQGTMPTFDVNDIWSAPGSDVILVGNGGNIGHDNGTGWKPMPSGTTDDLSGLWGFAPNDMYAVGRNGTILHYTNSVVTTTTSVFATTSILSTTTTTMPTTSTSSVVITTTIPATTTSAIVTTTIPTGTTSVIITTTTTTAPLQFYADFTATPVLGPAPLDVQFTDASSPNASGHTWDFGDGTGGTGKTPKHVYQITGDYTVNLSVTGPDGAPLKKTKIAYIKVIDTAPVADFTASVTEGAAPLSVLFTDTSTGIITAREWSFGDGETSDQASIRHTFAAAGSYTVSLKVAGPDGISTKIREAFITVSPGFRTSAVSGRVTGNAQAGIDINLSGANLSLTTQTGSDGTYDFAGILNGQYRVTPILPGYVFDPTCTQLRVFGRDLTGIDFRAIPSGPNIEQVYITPDSTSADGMAQFSLFARVTHPDGPGAIASVTADLTAIGGLADAALRDDGTAGDAAAGDGLYTLVATVSANTDPGLKPLGVTARDMGGAARTAFAGLSVFKQFTDTVAPDETKGFKINNGLAGQTLVFTLNLNGGGGGGGSPSLHGRTETSACTPTVVVLSPGEKTSTGQTGSQNGSSGQITIEVPNAEAGQWTCQVSNNACATTVSFGLESTIAGMGIVSGMVVDTRTGTGIGGVNLLTTGGISSQTDEGVYVMLHPSGMFSMSCSAEGFLPATRQLTVNAGGSTELYVALDNGTLTGSCFLTKSLGENSAQLQTLRHFRDSVLGATAQGKRYAGLYYRHSPEILAMMQKDRQLAEDIYRCASSLMPLVEQMMQGREPMPDVQQRSLFAACLEKIRSHAKPQLKAETERVLKLLEKNQPFNSILR